MLINVNDIHLGWPDYRNGRKFSVVDEHLRKSITEIGMVQPVNVATTPPDLQKYIKEKYICLDGNNRILVCRDLQIEMIQANILIVPNEKLLEKHYYETYVSHVIGAQT